MLWQEVEAEVEVVVVANTTESNRNGVVEVLVFRELTQTVAITTGETSVEQFIHCSCHVETIGTKGVHNGVVAIHVGQIIVCLTVALIITIREAVAELEVSAVSNRFTVGCLYGIVASSARGGVVAVVDVSRFSFLTIADIGSRKLPAPRVGESTCESQCDVASFVIQFAIDLQFTVSTHTVRIVLATAVISIHNLRDERVDISITCFIDMADEVSFCLLECSIGIIIRIYIVSARFAKLTATVA